MACKRPRARLKTVHRAPPQELDHTAATLASMETSHATLGRAKDEYGGQHASLKTSRGLLGVLNWQSKSVRRGRELEPYSLVAARELNRCLSLALSAALKG